MNKSGKSKVESRKIKAERKKPLLSLSISVLLSLSLLAGGLCSCNPEAKWVTDNVKVSMSITTVSAGFIECTFSTDKEAYYLVAIEPVRKDYNPMDHQKQFMTLALDSANVAYLKWRNELLKQGEFYVAPFASHALQYGTIDYFFTGLLPDEEYWIYAFVVNPETLQPSGKLLLQTVKTTSESIMDIHFDYRIKGSWDYIYPMDSHGNICGRFPYLATMLDSLTLVDEAISSDMDSAALVYFAFWALERFVEPEKAEVFYGVHAVDNDGWQSATTFQEGHTYYTALSGFDGSFKQLTVYKFTWTGDSCNIYLRDTDPENLMRQYH